MLSRLPAACVSAFGLGDVRQLEAPDHYGQHDQRHRDDDVRHLDGRRLLDAVRLQFRRQHLARSCAAVFGAVARISMPPMGGAMKVPNELNAWVSVKPCRRRPRRPQQRHVRIGRHLQCGDSGRQNDQRRQEQRERRHIRRRNKQQRSHRHGQQSRHHHSLVADALDDESRRNREHRVRPEERKLHQHDLRVTRGRRSPSGGESGCRSGR